MTHALREVVIVFRVLVAEGHLHGSGGSMNHFEPQCEVVNIADQQFASGWALCPLRLPGDGPGGTDEYGDDCRLDGQYAAQAGENWRQP